MILFLIQLTLVPLLSPLLVGVIRSMKARMQSRIGASMFQPYLDLLKLFRKDEIISRDASWISLAGPYIVFIISVLVPLGVPLLTVSAPTLSFPGLAAPLTLAPLGDFIVIVYLMALGAFFLALLGMDAGGGFGGFGASREMMVAALTEGGLFFALLSAALAGGSMTTFVIAGRVSELPLISYTPLIIGFSAFFIALLAENKRFPVDNPATHLELTMIHEALLLEYSGKRLALLEWAGANNLFIFIALGANLFFPWGIAAGESVAPAALLIALIALSGKALIALGAIAFIESVIAKLRIFRVPDLLFTSFVLGMIAVGIIIA